MAVPSIASAHHGLAVDDGRSAVHLRGLPSLEGAALADGSFAIAPSSPRVYLISGGKRRWVPDPTTLLALAPNGWASIVAVSDADLNAMPEGPQLPSRADGNVYIGAGAPEVYVIEALARHHIPDPATLEARYGGWSAVATVATADLDAIPLGAAVPSVDADDGSVDGYLRSLPDVNVDPVAEHRQPVGVTAEQVDGITYDVSREHASIVTQNEGPWSLSPVLDVLYPGALLQASSLSGGQLAPVAGGLARSGGTITVATDIHSQGAPPKSSSATVEKVTQASIQDARQQLLRALAPTDGAADVDYDVRQVRTTEHGLVKLGIAFSAGSFSGDLKSSLETSIEQTSVMVMFRQIFYSVTFTPPDGPHSFFDRAVTAAEVRTVSGANNPPVYLSQVDYGRMLVLSITGTTSYSDLKVALKAGVKAKAGGELEVSDDLKKTLRESTVHVMAIGGDGRSAMRLLSDPIAQLPEYLNAGGALTVDNPGAPLRYVARHAGSRNVVTINQATDYDEAVAAVGENVNDQIFQVWDGPGGGPKSTGILVANEDQLRITASGLNRSGILWTGTYGPDGWTTWERPSGSGYPLPDNHPFALAGAWDGAQTGDKATTDWFFIGTGVSKKVKHLSGMSSRVLYLGTNDNNPLNGDAKYKFTVNVSVARHQLANVGRAVG